MDRPVHGNLRNQPLLPARPDTGQPVLALAASLAFHAGLFALLLGVTVRPPTPPDEPVTVTMTFEASPVATPLATQPMPETAPPPPASAEAPPPALPAPDQSPPATEVSPPPPAAPTLPAPAPEPVTPTLAAKPPAPATPPPMTPRAPAPPKAAARAKAVPPRPESPRPVPPRAVPSAQATPELAPSASPTPPVPTPRLAAPALPPGVRPGLLNPGAKPPYPDAASKRREQGTVRLSFSCDESGRVGDIAIAASSGSAVLDNAAREFLSRQPCARAAGHFEIPYHFELPDE